MVIIINAIKHYLVIKSPAEKVYNALTKLEGLASWWTEDTSGNTEVDSIIEFNFGEDDHNKMKITRLEKNRMVEWECIVGDEEWIGTKFLFTLEPNEDRTIIRFSHFDWKSETDFFASCNYHWGYYLRSLKLYCETGKGTPFNL
ncbi:MAG: SRPBCC domain-containing protein [Melioribacteraceae bacterium]|nr:SRPBCC domain-containing protein [Melioribacteraceae bacterium]